MRVGHPLTFNDGGKQHAAQATRVWSDTCVNLIWWDEYTGEAHVESSVPVLQVGEPGWGCWSAVS